MGRRVAQGEEGHTAGRGEGGRGGAGARKGARGKEPHVQGRKEQSRWKEGLCREGGQGGESQDMRRGLRGIKGRQGVGLGTGCPSVGLGPRDSRCRDPDRPQLPSQNTRLSELARAFRVTYVDSSLYIWEN